MERESDISPEKTNQQQKQYLQQSYAVLQAKHRRQEEQFHARSAQIRQLEILALQLKNKLEAQTINAQKSQPLLKNICKGFQTILQTLQLIDSNIDQLQNGPPADPKQTQIKPANVRVQPVMISESRPYHPKLKLLSRVQSRQPRRQQSKYLKSTANVKDSIRNIDLQIKQFQRKLQLQLQIKGKYHSAVSHLRMVRQQNVWMKNKIY